jgi:hypothetical protein
MRCDWLARSLAGSALGGSLGSSRRNARALSTAGAFRRCCGRGSGGILRRSVHGRSRARLGAGRGNGGGGLGTYSSGLGSSAWWWRRRGRRGRTLAVEVNLVDTDIAILALLRALEGNLLGATALSVADG